MNRGVSSRRHRLLVGTSLLVLCTLLLAACGGPSPSGSATPTPRSTGTAPPAGLTPTTVPLPPTQTSCPPAGTARVAVMAPLVRGSHPTVVYVENQMQTGTPISGTLKRYDLASKRETIIVSLPNTALSGAQVSADGQWVLFGTSVNHQSTIHLVRMDGQGLQTLYCGSKEGYSEVAALQWSPDQKYVAFRERQNVYLLNVATGTYRLAVAGNNHIYYEPRTWLDNSRLYLSGLLVGTQPLPLQLYLLDITSAHVQPVFNSPTLCGDFDSSLDGTHLFTSECVFAMPTTGGPSVIQVQPATGGRATTIYRTPTYGITQLRVVSPHTLLFVIHNTGVGRIDSSHNGLWKIHTDGTGLSRLTTEAADETTYFNLSTQYFWSTVSRDGAYYAVTIILPGTSSGRPTSVLIGPMSGGAPFTLARGTATTGGVAIAGWTTT